MKAERWLRGCELLEGIDSSSNGDDGQMIGAGGEDIGRGVSENEDVGRRVNCRANLLDGMRKDIGTMLKGIAPCAQMEQVEETGGCELLLADALKIACGHTEDGVLIAEVEEELTNLRQDVRAKLGSILFHVKTHLFADLRKLGTPAVFGDPCEREGIAQDADVGAAMRDNAVEVQGESGNSSEDFAEGEVVNGVGAVDESAVDIEEIGIEGIPGEGKAHATALRGERSAIQA